MAKEYLLNPTTKRAHKWFHVRKIVGNFVVYDFKFQKTLEVYWNACYNLKFKIIDTKTFLPHKIQLILQTGRSHEKLISLSKVSLHICYQHFLSTNFDSFWFILIHFHILVLMSFFTSHSVLNSIRQPYFYMHSYILHSFDLDVNYTITNMNIYLDHLMVYILFFPIDIFYICPYTHTMI